MSRKILFTYLLLTAGLRAQVAIVNAASFAPGQAVAAGSWAAAFGVFPGITTTTIPAPPFPGSLAGVKLTIEGVDAPLYDVRQTQITFLVPGSLTAGIHPVVVTTPGGTINGTVRIISSAPGLFVKDTATPPKGAVLNSSGAENTSSNPARRGDFISIYGTGPGAFAQSFTDGAAPGSAPLVNTKSTPQVFVGGVPATVQFSGLNPFSPGLWQLNVFIPDQPFLTGHVPLRVYVDGVDANEIGIVVQ